MASRLCRRCGAKVPAGEYQAHVQRHKNAGKEPHWDVKGREARSIALRRDGYRCRQCGRTKDQLQRLGLELHVHHVDGNRSNIATSNLMTLCEDHHRDTFLGNTQDLR